MADFVVCVDSHNLDKIIPLIESIRDHNENSRINVITDNSVDFPICDRVGVIDESITLHLKDPYRRINKATYYRLFIHKVFPDIEKCIYLDWDTLVLGDMTEELKGDDWIIKGYPQVNINGEVTHVNAGVLYFNFKNPKTISLMEECINAKGMVDDQQIINNIFGGHFNYISREYNFLPSYWRHGLNGVKCVHYIGPFKPWLVKSEHILWYELDKKIKNNEPTN